MVKIRMKKLIINIIVGTVCCVSGYLIGKKTSKHKIKYSGYLRVDQSEPDVQKRLFLECTDYLENIEKSDFITLKVIKKNYI